MSTRARVALGVFAAGAAVAAVATLMLSGDDGGSKARSTNGPESRRAVVEQYEARLEPLAYDAGRVVVEGLQEALSRLSEGSDDDADVLPGLARHQEVLLRLRAEMDALAPPSELEASAGKRRASMDAYLAVAETLEQAAAAAGASREALLDRSAELGKQADALWEQADDLLNRARHRLGLPTTTEPFSG